MFRRHCMRNTLNIKHHRIAKELLPSNVNDSCWQATSWLIPVFIIVTWQFCRVSCVLLRIAVQLLLPLDRSECNGLATTARDLWHSNVSQERELQAALETAVLEKQLQQTQLATVSTTGQFLMNRPRRECVSQVPEWAAGMVADDIVLGASCRVALAQSGSRDRDRGGSRWTSSSTHPHQHQD